jgi:hypothetical protein
MLSMLRLGYRIQVTITGEKRISRVVHPVGLCLLVRYLVINPDITLCEYCSGSAASRQSLALVELHSNNDLPTVLSLARLWRSTTPGVDDDRTSNQTVEGRTCAALFVLKISFGFSFGLLSMLPRILRGKRLLTEESKSCSKRGRVM